MKQPFSLNDKDGVRRHVDWDVFCEISKIYSGWTDTVGLPLLHSRRTALAADAYFDLVDRGFIGVEWY